MAAHAEHLDPNAPPERTMLQKHGSNLFLIGCVLALIGLGAAIGLGFGYNDHFRRFWFTYLTSFAFFLSIALGGLFFVLVQHLTRAAWSVSVRRIAENLSALMPILALLAIPLVVTVWQGNGILYRWALPVSNSSPAERADAHSVKPPSEKSNGGDLEEKEESNPPTHLDELTLGKRNFLNPTTFTVSMVVYFLAWIVMGWKFRRESILQDADGDIRHTQRLQILAGPCLVLYGLTVTFFAFHALMSLDPHWYSTIFGGYFFAGCLVSIFAALIAITVFLQKAGYLQRSVTVEHYHDIGKFQFGFVFFWGYIAFSQFMLLWYASIPETTEWFIRRGCTSKFGDVNAWTWWSLALLFGQCLIPFAGILSRHVKRRPGLMAFWAIWLLVFHYVDVYWIVMPELRDGLHFNVIDVAAFIGIGGVCLAVFGRAMGKHALRPLADPRLAEGLALVNL